MFRALKNWMSVVVLFVLIAAQVVPASALTISFTTGSAPIKITSSTPTLNQPDVGYSPTIQVNFSRQVNWIGVRSFKYGLTNATVVGATTPSGNDWLGVDLQGMTLVPGTQYYLEFFVKDTDMNSMDPTDPANSPYYDLGSGNYRLYFTTASAAGWQSTVINGVTAGINGGQTNVPIIATIRVKTTAALNGATVIAANNVVLHKSSAGGTIITATAVLDPDDATNKTVLVTPSANLEYSTTYYLVLDNVADTLGNVLP